LKERIPLPEEILSERETEIGAGFAGSKNHVYRMINFSLALECRFEGGWICRHPRTPIPVLKW
jgi:hypothetical protein